MESLDDHIQPTLIPREMSETEQGIKSLDRALEMLAVYLDPDDGHCSIDPEARKASRIYLREYVEGNLRHARSLLAPVPKPEPHNPHPGYEHRPTGWCENCGY